MGEEKVEYSPGLQGITAGETSISRVDPNGTTLIIRGYDIKDLVSKSDFQEVAYLVLHGELPAKLELKDFVKSLKNQRKIPKDLEKLVKILSIQKAEQMDILRTAVSFLGAIEFSSFEKSDNISKAISIMSKIPTIISYSYRFSIDEKPVKPKSKYSHSKNFLYMLNGKEPDDLESDVFDKSLMLYIDHDFNASTFTNRVIASTMSDIYSAVVGGIGALKGPRHGGANENTARMMLEVGSKENVVNFIQEKLSKKIKIPGFGHREYKVQDPRAVIMKDMFKQVSEKKGDMKLYEIADEIERVMKEEMDKKGKHVPPNVDFPCGGFYHTLGIPIELYSSIFAMSRVVGWSAHFIEQSDPKNPLIRPKALYVGESDLKYIPIRKR